jgi:hypothetical protein
LLHLSLLKTAIRQVSDEMLLNLRHQSKIFMNRKTLWVGL